MKLSPFSTSLTLALGLLCGCAATPEPVSLPNQLSAWAPDFTEQRSGPDGQALLQVDAAASTLSVHVFRAGRAARLGHNHVLTAPKLAGYVRLPGSALDLQSAGFELALRLDELQLDAPDARAALGAGWASSVSPEMVAATRANMLGEAGLQAASYPLLRVRSLRISGAYPKLAALIELELHGRRSQQWVALHVDVTSESVRAQGAMVVQQTAHGLTPFSVGGGLLAVQDELLIELNLLARR